jgi:hypothetical protein
MQWKMCRANYKKAVDEINNMLITLYKIAYKVSWELVYTELKKFRKKYFFDHTSKYIALKIYDNRKID